VKAVGLVDDRDEPYGDHWSHAGHRHQALTHRVLFGDRKQLFVHRIELLVQRFDGL
jgi:hypothetical protein